MRHLALALVGLLAVLTAGAQQQVAVIDGASPSPFFLSLQAEDGHWSSAHLGGRDLDPAIAVAGRKTDDLAVTAALTWMLIGDGNTITKGPNRDALERADRWLRQSLTDAARTSKDELVPGEALAFAVLADLNSIEHVAARGRLLATEMSRTSKLMSEDGTWWEGPTTSTEESTGWVSVARMLVRRSGRRQARVVGESSSRDWLLAEGRNSHTAAAFALYFEVIKPVKQGSKLVSDASELATRLDIADATADPPGPAAQFVHLAATYRLGGRLFASRSKLVRDELTRTQRREEPWKGGWPPSGDPRGSLWDFAWSVMSLQCTYRYSTSGMLR